MSENSELSSSMQDYLEAILELAENGEAVRVTDIANKLRIAKASVNQTLQKFKEKGYVKQEVYGPVELTLQGRALAEKVRHTHRKLRQFLVDVLGVDSKVAEEDACRMEHTVSPQTMERLADFLVRNHFIKEE